MNSEFNNVSYRNYVITIRYAIVQSMKVAIMPALGQSLDDGDRRLMALSGEIPGHVRLEVGNDLGRSDGPLKNGTAGTPGHVQMDITAAFDLGGSDGGPAPGTLQGQFAEHSTAVEALGG